MFVPRAIGLTFFVLLCAAASPACAQNTGPSFDCARASSPTEFAICGTPSLATLDSGLADAFRRRMAALSAADQTALRKQQKAWLKQRDICGADTACLDRTMTARLADLEAPGVGSVGSAAPVGDLVAPAPAGDLVAPAPAGGVVTSAPAGVGDPAPAVPAVAAEPSAEAATIDLDPFAPGGVSIGMKGLDAAAVLKRNGYDQYGRKSVAGGKGRRSVSFQTGKYRSGSPEEPVTRINYIQEDPDLQRTGIEFVKQMSETIGAEPDCAFVKEKVARCSWQSPPGAPLVLEVRLSFERMKTTSQISLTVEAVGDLEARMASPAASTGSSAPDFDPLAPKGVAIGMPLPEAEIALKEHGFRKVTLECDYAIEGQSAYRIRLHTGRYGLPTGCEPGKIVRAIQYQERDVRVEGSLTTLVKKLNGRLGVDAKCTKLDEHNVSCRWDAPPGAPLLQSAFLSASKTHFDFHLEGVSDLASRVEAPPTPAPVPLEAQPWWVQELAKAEARTEPFVGSERFSGLPPDEQQRLAGEAATVRAYCRKSGMFADLHDCTCVAGKFIDARLAKEEEARAEAAKTGAPAPQRISPAPEIELIGIADEVADQCPNKAGTARYAYEGCIGTYAIKMQDTLEAFCTCYADTFANVYMEQPVNSFPHLQKVGVRALQACKKN
jgi:uncharacterized protein YecT (DUF1311 family)